MITVKDLTIKVTYEVGLGNVTMPKSVYDQLLLADENFKEIDPSMIQKDYKEASDWLVNNIKESDCKDWIAEVLEISEIE